MSVLGFAGTGRQWAVATAGARRMSLTGRRAAQAAAASSGSAAAAATAQQQPEVSRRVQATDAPCIVATKRLVATTPGTLSLAQGERSGSGAVQAGW